MVQNCHPNHKINQNVKKFKAGFPCTGGKCYILALPLPFRRLLYEGLPETSVSRLHAYPWSSSAPFFASCQFSLPSSAQAFPCHLHIPAQNLKPIESRY